MNLEKETALVEAVLFLEADPIDLRTLSRITGLGKDVVVEAVSTLQQKLANDEHGLEVAELGGGFILSPKKELWDHLKEHYGKRNENRLSRAALETLSIIAYSQPITKGEIEALRGVSADGMIKLLTSRQLIREVGKKDAPGKPVQFGTTKEFLRTFRLGSIADLPRLDEVDRDRFELDATE
jgi:segregation and condensation protein B